MKSNGQEATTKRWMQAWQNRESGVSDQCNGRNRGVRFLIVQESISETALVRAFEAIWWRSLRRAMRGSGRRLLPVNQINLYGELRYGWIRRWLKVFRLKSSKLVIREGNEWMKMVHDPSPWSCPAARSQTTSDEICSCTKERNIEPRKILKEALVPPFVRSTRCEASLLYPQIHKAEERWLRSHLGRSKGQIVRSTGEERRFWPLDRGGESRNRCAHIGDLRACRQMLSKNCEILKCSQ
jgi:hypothetical protein